MRDISKKVCMALLILVLSTGCAYLRETVMPAIETRRDLALARELSDRGEFGKAEEEYQSIIKRYHDSPLTGDALYELSLLYISPKNKKKDFRKAQDGFQSFLERYPLHRKAEMARYLVVVLKKVDSLETDMKELKDVLIKLEMMEKELKK